MRPSKILISIAILLAIGLHLVPWLRRGPGARNIFWPFLTWTMYRDSRPPGPIKAVKRHIIGVTQKGQTEEITASLVGLGPPAMSKLYIRPLLAGDASAGQKLVDRINPGREDPFVAIRIEDETYTVTDTGLVREDSPVLTYRVEPSKQR
jgi:hypothetical protein